MMRSHLKFRMLGLAAMFSLGMSSAVSVGASSEGSAGPRLIAFLHATVIPMDRERTILDQTVVVADGKIVEIGPSSKVEAPAGAFRVDAAGRYLIPALCDMHVHLLSEAWNMMLRPDVRLTVKDVPYERFLFPYLANGVTMVQEMFATPEGLALRQQIDRGELLGPRLILARALDGPKKGWPPPLTTWVESANPTRRAPSKWASAPTWSCSTRIPSRISPAPQRYPGCWSGAVGLGRTEIKKRMKSWN